MSLPPTRQNRNISVPLKYKSTDFQEADFWRPDADGSVLITWAGLNPLQLVTAITAQYRDLKDGGGREVERLKPLLGGIHEQVPWIEQCDNEPDSEHGTAGAAAHRAIT